MPPVHELDFENLSVSRTQCSMEVFWEIQEAIRGCACYEKMMQVEMISEAAEHDDVNVPFRIYRPAGRNEKLPVVLYTHGGSFMMNHLEVYDNVCRYLAFKGKMLVIAPEYRLAPENRYPAGLEDCYCVMRWIAGHAEEAGGDPEKLYVCGDSSGGNFAAVLSTMARDRGDISIKGQILIYPVTVLQPPEKTKSELVYGTGFYLEYDSTRNPFGPYCDEAEKEQGYLSPLYSENLEKLPDALFIQAGCDPLLDQGLMYAARLQDGGNSVSVKIYEGMLHGFISQNYQKTFEALNTICDFVHEKS